MLYKPFFALLFGMALAPLVLTFGPIVEGKLFPVIKSFSISEVVSDFQNPNVNLMYGTATKIRGRCEFDHVEWFLSQGSNSVRINDFKILEKNKVRLNGFFEWGPWSIDIDKTQIFHKTHAYVYHHCHFLWLTKSLLWQSTEQ